MFDPQPHWVTDFDTNPACTFPDELFGHTIAAAWQSPCMGCFPFGLHLAMGQNPVAPSEHPNPN